MDFTKFKHFISDLFTRETRPIPNFALIKLSFEYIDLRKDGIIDINEWLKAFSMTESSLDYKNVINPSIQKELREWENSRDISTLHSLISRNKKIIKSKAKEMLMKGPLGSQVINAENLISILKEVFQGKINLHNTQWKIVVSIADRDRSSMIDFDLFMNLVEKSTKQHLSHPKIK